MRNILMICATVLLFALPTSKAVAQSCTPVSMGFIAAYATPDVTSQVSGLGVGEQTVWLWEHRRTIDLAYFNVRQTLYSTPAGGEANVIWRKNSDNGVVMWEGGNRPCFEDISRQGTMLCARIYSGGIRPVMTEHVIDHGDGSFSVCSELHDEWYRQRGPTKKHGTRILLEVPR